MSVIKPWYTSRTIWASAVTVLLAVGGFFGLPIAQVDGGALTEAVIQTVTAVAGIVAILGRLNATTRIA